MTESEQKAKRLETDLERQDNEVFRAEMLGDAGWMMLREKYEKSKREIGESKAEAIEVRKRFGMIAEEKIRIQQAVRVEIAAAARPKLAKAIKEVYG